ncbi:MAG: HNH endonuclease [Actinobacteria bacterium]|nr:HNH endonuclease [Actinomycetota bacterium]
MHPGEAAKVLRTALLSLRPDALSGRECASLAEELARTAKSCEAAAASLAAWASDRGAYRDKGFTDGAEWFARASGSSPTAAKAAMETAWAVEECPETKAAVLAGDVSMEQAGIIARTEFAVPGSEADLLGVAKSSSLKSLKDSARDTRLGSMDVDELARRQRKARCYRHWRDELGMVRGTFALTPEVGVPIVNGLDAEADRLRKAAKKQGEPEAWEAYAADALAARLQGGGHVRGSRAELVVVADINALRHGHAEPGEPCHVVGGGPIPVEVARELSKDAFIKAVLHDGVDVLRVEHFGRHIKAELRTALELGPAPQFPGKTCCEPGCGRQHNLEWDHVDPVNNNGPTSFDNLKPRCWPHHRDKTERDRKAGLLRPKASAERGPP